MRAIVVGCGYVGFSVAKSLASKGMEVFGLRRRWEDPATAETVGVKPLSADLTRPGELNQLPGPFDWVVNCVSSRGGEATDYREIYLEGTRRLLDWLEESRPTRFVYTSSTGVYGQIDGSAVIETSPTEPGTETGEILVRTENLLLQAARESGFPALVLRVAGIYGPDRGYWLRQFLAGQATLEGTGQRYLNLIHRDDVVGAVLAALHRGRIGEVYNAVDNEPVTQGELLRWLAEQTGRPLPPSRPAEPVGARRRGLTHKRVLNHKLRTETGWAPRYPTFREGFAEELARRSTTGG